jgi:hypothetical protein
MRDCNFIEEESQPLYCEAAAPVAPPDLHSYDIYAIGFSGGKDSWAALLNLLESGVPPEKIELHHQKVDGQGPNFMDWPCASSYVDKAGAAFGIPVYHSWKEGGFEREMLKQDAKTAPISWYTKDGQVRTMGGDRGKLGTRRMFPQTSPDLRVRWCSAYLKIDVFARVLTNDERFQNKRVLVITGERAEESAARANYATFERHRTDLRDGKKTWRHIDHWRPVHGWSEAQVWAILQKFRVNPHPAYWLGFSRCSCRGCVFSGPDEWATLRTFMPDAFAPIAAHESDFGVTIHRTLSINEQADRGVPHPCSLEMLLLAESTDYYANIIVEGDWVLPPGAYKKGNGPT